MTRFRKDNELLPAALMALKSEELKNAYLDKKPLEGTTEPDWWTYEDNDPAWIKEHSND